MKGVGVGCANLSPPRQARAPEEMVMSKMSSLREKCACTQIVQTMNSYSGEVTTQTIVLRVEGGRNRLHTWSPTLNAELSELHSGVGALLVNHQDKQWAPPAGNSAFNFANGAI